MKKIFAATLTAALLFANSTDAARYFTQGDKIGSSTPYGDNVENFFTSRRENCSAAFKAAPSCYLTDAEIGL